MILGNAPMQNQPAVFTAGFLLQELLMVVKHGVDYPKLIIPKQQRVKLCLHQAAPTL